MFFSASQSSLIHGRSRRAMLTALCLVICLAVLSACSLVEPQNALMDVQAQPPSPGYAELMRLGARSAELRDFLGKRGLPDRIISDHRAAEQKVVLYYVKNKQAYLFVSKLRRAGDTGRGDILGPSPIGEKTLELFKAIDQLKRATDSLNREEALRAQLSAPVR